MLADAVERTGGVQPGPTGAPGADRRRRLEAIFWSATAFTGGLALVLIYALRGGAYDPIVFEEYGVVIWFVLGTSAALGLLPRVRPSAPAMVLIATLAGYTAWSALSLVWSTSSELTTTAVARDLDYLGLVVLLTAVADRDRWHHIAAGLGAGALLVCVIAVGARLAPSLFGTDVVANALHTDRLSAPFGYWNAVAAWAAMAAGIGLAWSSHERQPALRASVLALVPVAGLAIYLTYSRQGGAEVAVAALGALIFGRARLTTLVHAAVAGAMTTVAIVVVQAQPSVAANAGTRGAGTVAAVLIAGCAVCFVTGLLTSKLGLDGKLVSPRLAKPLLATGAVVLIGVGAVFGPHLASRAWHSFKQPAVVQGGDPTSREVSLSGGRYQVWKQAVRAFQHSPVTGSGAGTFGLWWDQHGATAQVAENAHSIWLENLATLGAPGLLLILGALGTAGALIEVVRRRIRRRTRAGPVAAASAALVAYLVAASVDWMWESTAVTVLALALVATAAGRLSEGGFDLRWPVRAGLAAAAVACIVVQVPDLLSHVDIGRSQAAARSGDLTAALSWAGDAVSAEPWSATALQQRGLVEERSGRLELARRDLQSAIDHERANYVHWVILARIDTELGDLNAASRAYNRARALAPRLSLFAAAA